MAQTLEELREMNRIRSARFYEVNKDRLNEAKRTERALEAKPKRSDEDKRKDSRRNTKKWRDNSKELVRERLLEMRKRNQKYVNEIKSRTPCRDCDNIFHPCAMDFHHLPGTEKRGGRSGGVTGLVSRGCSLEAIQAEIDKCELLCAVCHRIQTFVTDNA